MKKNLLHILLAGGLLFLSFACGKEEEYNVLPYAKVEFLFYPYENGAALGAYGGIRFFPNEGYNRNGVYVCNIGTENLSFLAFDATCPKEGDHKTAVEIVPSAILKLKCPKCGKVYSLIDNPSGLQRYPVRTQGYGNYFMVVN